MARTAVVRFRVTKEEKEKIKRLAKSKDLTLSKMIRKLWLQSIKRSGL